MKEESEVGEKIDNFANKYKLWLIIPLIICGAIALKSVSAAAVFFAFFCFVWVFGGMIAIFLWGSNKLISKRATEKTTKEIQEAIGGTIFLGGCALIGMILRGNNIVSNFLVEKVPNGVSIGFIDPIFAVVCIVFIWLYTAYRIFN